MMGKKKAEDRNVSGREVTMGKVSEDIGNDEVTAQVVESILNHRGNVFEKRNKSSSLLKDLNSVSWGK